MWIYCLYSKAVHLNEKSRKLIEYSAVFGRFLFDYIHNCKLSSSESTVFKAYRYNWMKNHVNPWKQLLLVFWLLRKSHYLYLVQFFGRLMFDHDKLGRYESTVLITDQYMWMIGQISPWKRLSRVFGFVKVWISACKFWAFFVSPREETPCTSDISSSKTRTGKQHHFAIAISSRVV